MEVSKLIMESKHWNYGTPECPQYRGMESKFKGEVNWIDKKASIEDYQCVM